MKYCGRNVYLRPTVSDFKGLCNMSVGDNTSIPKGSIFYCTEAPLTIGNNVIFGPRPTIITGEHRVDVIGECIIGGVPAKVLKYRFTIDEVMEHERLLYPEDKRLNREELVQNRS